MPDTWSPVTLTHPEQLARASRAAFHAAVSLGALAFVARILVLFWLEPLAWQLPIWLDFVVMMTATVTAVAAPLGAYVLRFGRQRRLPRTLLIDKMEDAGRVFVVPASPWVNLFAIMACSLGGGAVVTQRTPTDNLVIPTSGVLPSVLGIGACLLLAGFLLRRGPRVVLTRDGLIVRGLRTHAVRWDELTSCAPARPGPNTAALYVRRRARRGLTRQSLRVPVRWLWVNPVLLASAIGDYIAEPRRRDEIGTRAEIDRLRGNAPSTEVTAVDLVGGRHAAGKHTTGSTSADAAIPAPRAALESRPRRAIESRPRRAIGPAPKRAAEPAPKRATDPAPRWAAGPTPRRASGGRHAATGEPDAEPPGLDDEFRDITG